MTRLLACESVTFWRDPVLADMEVLKATYVTHSFSRHSHEGYAIGTIESGAEAFTYRGMTYQAPAGTLVVIHPGEVHTGYAGQASGWQYRMIYPPCALVQQAAEELGLPAGQVPFFPQPVIHDRALVQKFQAFHLALEQGASPLERESRLLWLAASMIQRHGERRSPKPQIYRGAAIAVQLKTYLYDHYAEAITLDHLAQTVNMPPLRLLRLCRREWGLPPHQYLIQIRVQQAKRLIATGLPLAVVAADTGFADQSHLTRHFKRWVGVTPGQYQGGCYGERMKAEE
ncbi:MAG: AraC family transcriptional regulator [Leptolyngbyaceae cyanobacterium SM1_1_3]|nr:AraC family transcriptional regulator [Leptolyngbyaceae cyanobacterium SM1_1_3]NJN04058.1 AraC family transcriptional regulator [Leptolyngbyaceae cyanobacterium RM1_1_2]NJO09728.1 AraC family transcriptional regulator [Leptolyngbyaceae cyanobacterium SL_1_1]